MLAGRLSHRPGRRRSVHQTCHHTGPLSLAQRFPGPLQLNCGAGHKASVRRQALWKLSSVVVPCLSDERPRERTCLLPDLGHMLSPRTRKTGPHRVRCVGPVRALDGSGNSHVDSAISKVIKEKHAWGYPVLAIE